MGKSTNKILLIIFSLPLVLGLLFYFGVILPENLACEEALKNNENERIYDIWGDEVFCDGDSLEFGKALEKMFFLFFGGYALLFLLVWYILREINLLKKFSKK